MFHMIGVSIFRLAHSRLVRVLSNVDVYTATPEDRNMSPNHSIDSNFNVMRCELQGSIVHM